MTETMLIRCHSSSVKSAEEKNIYQRKAEGLSTPQVCKINLRTCGWGRLEPKLDPLSRKVDGGTEDLQKYQIRYAKKHCPIAMS